MLIEKYSRIKPWIVHWHMHKGKYPFIQYSSTEVTTKNTHTYKNTQSHTHSQLYTYTNLHTHTKCKDENKLSLEFIEYERKTRIYSPSIKTEVCFLQTWTHVIWKQYFWYFAGTPFASKDWMYKKHRFKARSLEDAAATLEFFFHQNAPESLYKDKLDPLYK